MLTLKVAGKSKPATVAGAIANNIREGKDIEVVAMGPQSVNQAIKAITISRSYLVDDKIELTFRPEFMHLELDGERKSAIKLVVLTHKMED
ncbi:stage V sporulation protein S [bacterium]|nr:stage V sporulation protein S [bacterium]